MSDYDSDLDGFDIDFNDDPDSNAPVKEVYGSIEAIKREGSPQERAGSEEPIRYYFYPTWRSQIVNLIFLFILFIFTVIVSRYVPALVVAGSLFSIGKTTYFLHLPILTLVPGALLGKILINIYDAKYIIDDRGVEAQIGLVSMNLRQPRLRWEDIRGVEPNQTIWERW